MDDQRKGDVRVYIVTGLFFSCIVSGGVFLGLYMFLPETQSAVWYPIAGIALVSIPWIFWFFTIAYRCVRPAPPMETEGHNNAHFHKTGSGSGCASNRVAAMATVQTMTTVVTTATTEELSDCESPFGAGDRRVQFGTVVVLGNQGDHNAGPQDRESSELSNCSRESEIPLRLS